MGERSAVIGGSFVGSSATFRDVGRSLRENERWLQHDARTFAREKGSEALERAQRSSCSNALLPSGRGLFRDFRGKVRTLPGKHPRVTAPHSANGVQEPIAHAQRSILSSGAVPFAKRDFDSRSANQHLCAQGAVGANLLLTDRAFRKKLDEKLPASHRVGWEQPDAREYEVVYAIVEASGRALVEALPFFSRLTLRNAARQLGAVGIRVSAALVSVARSERIQNPRRRENREHLAAYILKLHRGTLRPRQSA